MALIYREAGSPQELEALLNLRYLTYAEDQALRSMVPVNGNDLSYFDLNSYHFGAFDGDRAVAYMRMATAQRTPTDTWVMELARTKQVLLQANCIRYPFQTYSPDKKWNEDFLSSLKGRWVGEAGKLAIHKDYRKGKYILDDFISAFVSYCKEQKKFDTGFGSCTLQLERYYRKFGFVRVEGAKPFVYNGLPEAVIVRFDK